MTSADFARLDGMVIESRLCAWCDHSFTPKDPSQNYCNLVHTRLAKKDRRERGDMVVRAGLEPRDCLWCRNSFVPSDPTQVFLLQDASNESERG